MPSDSSCSLWSEKDGPFFREIVFIPILQSSQHCVSTSLAILTGQNPDYFQGKINTQDPVSWSNYLNPFGKKLAYCPSDIRRIDFYLPELLKLDDLFLLCYYTHTEEILNDPRKDGWLIGSHVVILHRDQVIDPAKGNSIEAHSHPAKSFHTKRIFRVLPLDHQRGL